MRLIQNLVKKFQRFEVNNLIDMFMTLDESQEIILTLITHIISSSFIQVKAAIMQTSPCNAYPLKPRSCAQFTPGCKFAPRVYFWPREWRFNLHPGANCEHECLISIYFDRGFDLWQTFSIIVQIVHMNTA